MAHQRHLVVVSTLQVTAFTNEPNSSRCIASISIELSRSSRDLTALSHAGRSATGTYGIAGGARRRCFLCIKEDPFASLNTRGLERSLNFSTVNIYPDGCHGVFHTISGTTVSRLCSLNRHSTMSDPTATSLGAHRSAALSL